MKFPHVKLCLCPAYSLLSTLACTLASVTQWAGWVIQHDYSSAGGSKLWPHCSVLLCHSLSLFFAFLIYPLFVRSKKPPSSSLINTRCTRAKPSPNPVRLTWLSLCFHERRAISNKEAHALNMQAAAGCVNQSKLSSIHPVPLQCFLLDWL